MSISLILLLISLFTWGIGEGMFFYFQPIYLAQLGADTMLIASVYSAFGAAMMLAHIPAGYLADRVGRKPLLLAAWTSGLVATWVMALARELPIFIIGMLLYGFTAFVSSPLNSYVTTARGKLSPARAMTLMSAGFSLGAVIGPLVGGWIGETIDLRIVYFVSAGLFLVSTAVLWFIKPQPREVHDAQAVPVKLLSNTRFIGFIGIAFLVIFSTYLPQPLTPRFLESERNLPLSAIGLLGSFNGLGNALFNLVLGTFSTRLGLVLVQVCAMAFSVLIWRGTGLEWYIAGYVILGGTRASKSFIFAEIRSLIHPAQMGIAFGITETFNSLAQVLAPLLAGVLYTRVPVLVFMVALGLQFMTLLVVGSLTPQTKTGKAVALPHTLEP